MASSKSITPQEAAAYAELVGPGDLVSERYRIKKLVGRGGMGNVLLATDEALDRDIAIKMIRPGSFTAGDVAELFLVEARAMAGVRHPNVVQIYEYGEHQGNPYFVMEYVPGKSAAEWLDECEDQRAPAAIDAIIGVLDQACRGLSAIHAQGIVHADVKPGNVLIGPAFRVAMTDFGLVRTLGAQDNHEMVVGTPAYIAPEIVYSADAVFSPQIDIFALAVMAYEMFTLCLPFAIEDVNSLFDVHLRKVPALEPSALRSDLPDAFDEVLLRGLARDLGERYRTADEFRKALLEARETISAYSMSIRIVIADDDPDFLAVAREAVSFAFPGADIVCAKDGHEAINAIEEKPLSLAILDLDMPGMNGIEITAAMRAREATKGTPVIVVSATGGSSDWRLLQNLGAQGFLVKPLDAYALVALSRKALGVA